MKASVLLTLQMTDTEAYKIDLNIPTTTPSKEAPFLFCVTQVISGSSKDNVLEVAIGDGDNYFVGVAPPGSLLVEAGIDNVVKDLQVVVAEGNYDKTSHTFTDSV